MLLEEVMNFNARMYYEDMGHMRTKALIVDTDTGEIIYEKHMANVLHVFTSGANAVIAEFMLSREYMPNGSIHYFLKDPKTGYLYHHWWEGKKKFRIKPRATAEEAEAGADVEPEEEQTERKPKHTGGKPSYVKIMSKNMDKLTSLKDADAGFLLKLSNFVDWGSGMLVDKHCKIPLSIDAMSSELKVSRDTAERRVTSLKQANALTVTPEGYFILSRDYVQKG